MGPVYITVGKAAAQVIPHGISFSRVHRFSMSTVSGTVVHIVNDPHTSLLPFMLLCLFLFSFVCSINTYIFSLCLSIKRGRMGTRIIVKTFVANLVRNKPRVDKLSRELAVLFAQCRDLVRN